MRLLRRGWRVSQRMKTDIVAVYVENRSCSEAEQIRLKNDFCLADRLNIPVVTLHGDIAAELIRYARENNITQVVIGHSSHSRWHEIVKGSLIQRLLHDLRTIDILLVASQDDSR